MGTAPSKQAKRLESTMVTQERQISSLTAQNEEMITAMTALGIDIPKSDPSSDKEDGEDRKMAANKKNSNLTKTHKRRK